MSDQRLLRYFEAIQEATAQAMEADETVTIMGLGVPDPGGIFGSTKGLQERFGEKRVMDMPLAENAMTGVAIGAALTGQRPILTHQRVDFALTAMEQMINQAAKWRYMFGGQHSVPLLIRMIIGRGWGQGPQHAQALHSLFAHIPGLKVIMPATAKDAKGMIMAAIADDDPVICLEHRWCYGVPDAVPKEPYQTKLGRARVARKGDDVSLISASYSVLECLAAAELLSNRGVEAEVLDLRSLRPLDRAAIARAAHKTGRVIAVDPGWTGFGLGAEVLAIVTELAFPDLKIPPRRIGLPDCPAPSSPALSAGYYPTPGQIAANALDMLGEPVDEALFDPPEGRGLDQPDPSFAGPF